MELWTLTVPAAVSWLAVLCVRWRRWAGWTVWTFSALVTIAAFVLLTFGLWLLGGMAELFAPLVGIEADPDVSTWRLVVDAALAPGLVAVGLLACSAWATAVAARRRGVDDGT